MEFLKLAVFTACLVSSSSGQSPDVCSVNVPCNKLQETVSSLTTTKEALEQERQEIADTKSTQEELRKLKNYQDDLKDHLLRRLDALDEKTAWCLSEGQQGPHPLGDRLAKIEAQLEQQNVTMTAIKDFLMGPRDCQQLYERGHRSSGVYTIIVDGFNKMDVYCEQELDGGGWLVFQRRYDGSVDFYRNWADFKTGFGDLTGEFWYGNDALHLLTRNHDQKLKIELKFSDETKYADYSTFVVEDERQNYKLTVTGFSGATPPGDSFSYHNQANFSTKDRDNDSWNKHCAQEYRGAWWHKSCHHSNLNGLYGSTDYAKGISWMHWKGHYISLTGTRMMIKQKP